MKADAQIQTMRDMASAATVVRAFSTSDSARAMCAMLDALIESYKIDLMHVSVDGLVKMQAAIQQTQAIRNVVADESQDLPKI